MLPVEIHPLLPADTDRALAMVRAASPETWYTDALLEVIRAAATAPGIEASGLVAKHGGCMAGVAVYGEYAGATGAGRLHLVAVDTQSRSLGVGAALVARAVEDLIARGARFVIAEIPDDETALDGYRSLLAACSFSEEARVPDLYRDGVALSFMRRDLGAAS
ncbi:MAG TPA: GNAT family N-acetyltransferase [Gemmatimonadaceae bacterium]